MYIICLKKILLYLVLFLTVLPANMFMLYGVQETPSRSFRQGEEILVSYIDSVCSAELKKNDVPGAALVLVSGDSILFSKGYGYANLRMHYPMNPDEALFRIASVSKVVTAAAIMKLVSEGKLDLDEDVNNYLESFKVPDTFPEPVTLRTLLTHTAGFDDEYIGKSTRDGEPKPSLSQFLKENLPDRIVPPGKVPMYSNLGIALAALAAEEETGIPFKKYVYDNICVPLEMENSGFEQKVGLKRLTEGYVYEGGGPEEFHFDYLNDYPAGQFLSTVEEFANFMIMLLDNGKFKGKQVLDSSAVALMQEAQFSRDARLAGSTGITLNINDYNGYKMLSHDGGYPGVNTRMRLFPELKLGLFVAINRMSPSFLGAVSSIPLLPKIRKDKVTKNSPPEGIPEYDPDINRFTGYYRYARYNRSSLAKTGVLAGMLGPELPLWSNNDGMLVMYDFFGNERRMIQTEPLYFKSLDDDYSIAFVQDEEGNITHLFTNGTTAFEKVPWFYTTSVQRYTLVAILVIFVSILVTGFIKLFIRNLKGKRLADGNIAHGIYWTASLFIFHLAACGIVIGLSVPTVEIMLGFAYGIPAGLYVAQALLLAAIVSLFYTLFSFWKNITAKKVSFVSGFFPVLFIIVSGLYLWILNYWNVLGVYF